MNAAPPRLTLALALAVSIGASASTARAEPPAHDQWDALLERHVAKGLVDYAALGRERAALDAYLARLATAGNVESWPRNEQLAFWINAYNALMVERVLDHYPIRGDDPRFPSNSVLQVDGIFKSIASDVAGRKVTLDQIEHRIIRPGFREPRVHFALVCASASCPDLRPEAYVAGRLDAQLEDQTRRFLTDRRRNDVDLAAGVARLTKLFEWFAEDFRPLAADRPALRHRFGPDRAGAVALTAKHLPEQAARALLAGRLRLELLEYDWALNDRADPPSLLLRPSGR